MVLATFFQWRVHAGREDEFVAAWQKGTKLLASQGSLGSTLFRNKDGGFSALARWPDAQTRDAAFDYLMDHIVFVQMRDCIAETVRRDDTEEICNMWASA